MPVISNPQDIHAAIIFENGVLKMVVPDQIEARPGQSVQWVITPSNHNAEVVFPNDTPFAWPNAPSKSGRIEGTVERKAAGLYRYSVRDLGSGGNTIDPHIGIKR